MEEEGGSFLSLMPLRHKYGQPRANNGDQYLSTKFTNDIKIVPFRGTVTF